MEWLQMIGSCILAAVMVMLLRQLSPPIAALCSAAFGAMLVSALLPSVGAYISEIRSFLGSLGLEGEYYAVMLRAMGVVLVTQLSVEICRELDAPAVAKRAELCGRMALMGVALPVFVSLTRMAVEALR